MTAWPRTPPPPLPSPPLLPPPVLTPTRPTSMSEHPIRIASVNAHRSTAQVQGLLQCSSFDIILLQEPWVGTINVQRSDSDPHRTDITGTTYNNLWESFLPSHSPDDVCKVAAYVRCDLARWLLIRNRLTLPFSGPNCLVLDIASDDEAIRLINFYHCVPPTGHGLHSLLAAECNDVVPTVLCGDFNTHSRMWSLPSATLSPWAIPLEEWFDANDFDLISPPRTITWISDRPGQTSSVLDLVLLNVAGVVSDQFSDASVSFADSLGSDHATLLWTWTPISTIPSVVSESLPGFVIDDDLADSWAVAFPHRDPAPLFDVPSLVTEADSLLADINDTCASLFKPHCRPDPRGVRWWTDSCSAALSIVQSCTGAERRLAAAAFRRTVLDAKREWGGNFLFQPNVHDLWQATRWWHGRKSTCVPPLRSPSGDVTRIPAEMDAALADRFFPSHGAPVAASQPDDPPPLPTRDLASISLEELASALSSTSNKSAPGPSGIGYKLLKWAFAASPDRFVRLFDACLSLGHHPWRSARVLPLPKPSRPDYSLPKAYRPIALLECCGKWLEKIVASRVLSDINTHHLLPRNQFGSRNEHCAVDAALALVHTAQQGVRAGSPVSSLFFDIQGFFDHIRRDHAVHLFRILGFPSQLCAWLLSFLSDRTVVISFNDFTGEARTLSDSSPQGSPLSPILSAIYTFPLLRLAESWNFCSLQLYVDDGSITASGPTFRSSARTAAQYYEVVSEWLLHCGLTTDPDKLEFISFRWPGRLPATLGAPFSHLGVRDAVHGALTVPCSQTVRYLGVYLHAKLSWDAHVKIMCCRARSMVRALHILGNSIRGLDFANWRRVFHAIILPVLTYGSQLWFSGRGQRICLIKQAQVAQNDAIRQVARCFHMTPVDPLHHLLAILPIRYTLEKLNGSFSDRLLRLPPIHALRTLMSANTAALWDSSLAIPTTLSSLLPPSFPTYVLPAPPFAASWSHCRVSHLFTVPPPLRLHTSTRNLLCAGRRLGLYLIISLYPHPDHFIACFVLLRNGQLEESGWRRGRAGTEALLLALVDGLRLASGYHVGPLRVFLPNRAVAPLLFKLSKHTYLPLSSDIVSLVSNFVDFSPDLFAEFHWFSVKWAHVPGCDTLRRLGEDASSAPPPPLSSPVSRKDAAFESWRLDYHYLPRAIHFANVSFGEPCGNRLPPYTSGLLKSLNRRYWSAGIQLTTRHCFDADYSFKFCPSKGDETLCPCSYDAADSLRRFSEEDPFTHPPTPEPLTSHTVAHVLTDCTLTADLRSSVLQNRSLNHIFSTEAGGYNLCRFLHLSQLLLRPLEPRPEPPDPH